MQVCVCVAFRSCDPIVVSPPAMIYMGVDKHESKSLQCINFNSLTQKSTSAFFSSGNSQLFSIVLVSQPRPLFFFYIGTGPNVKEKKRSGLRDYNCAASNKPIFVRRPVLTFISCIKHSPFAKQSFELDVTVAMLTI